MSKRIRASYRIFNMFPIIAIAASVVLMTPGYMGFSAFADEPQSSFDYKNFDTDEEYRVELRRKMKRIYETFEGKMIDDKTIPIPGLTLTYTIKEGKLGESDNFVPQGLCRAKDYMLVTAYDVKKRNNSVIYVVDFANRDLVSTLTLPNKYHAGGIAFDGENIWMTGETSDKYKGDPFVQYMKYDRFLELIQDPVSEVKENDISKNIRIKNKPSFLECDKDTLWVGTYIGRILSFSLRAARSSVRRPWPSYR